MYISHKTRSSQNTLSPIALLHNFCPSDSDVSLLCSQHVWHDWNSCIYWTLMFPILCISLLASEQFLQKHSKNYQPIHFLLLYLICYFIIHFYNFCFTSSFGFVFKYPRFIFNNHVPSAYFWSSFSCLRLYHDILYLISKYSKSLLWKLGLIVCCSSNFLFTVICFMCLVTF